MIQAKLRHPHIVTVFDFVASAKTLAIVIEFIEGAPLGIAGGAWNPQVDPLVKLNDRHGAWAVSYRFGPENEFRVGRVPTF